MKKLPNGDWELIVELPKGRHECKFVINESNWICNSDMEITQDANGNRNNVVRTLALHGSGAHTHADNTPHPPCDMLQHAATGMPSRAKTGRGRAHADSVLPWHRSLSSRSGDEPRRNLHHRQY
jgi:hypothetical protein